MTEPIQLEYGTSPRVWRKRMRRALLVILIAAVGFCAWRWGPVAWTQARILYLQRQCLNQNPPPDLVVYEEDQTRIEKFMGRPGFFARSTFDLSNASLPLRDLPEARVAAAYQPRCWANFLSVASIAPIHHFPTGAMMFLGRLKTPSSGQMVLVAVTYGPEHRMFQPEMIPSFNCEVVVIRPGAAFSRPVMVQPPSVRTSILNKTAQPPPKTRIYAGQIDPADPSRFTIRYKMWDQEDTIDGRLGDDLRVTLSQRSIPKWPRD